MFRLMNNKTPLLCPGKIPLNLRDFSDNFYIISNNSKKILIIKFAK